MKIYTQPNEDLVIEADDVERGVFALAILANDRKIRWKRGSEDLLHDLLSDLIRAEGFDWTYPEALGALTSGEMVHDGERAWWWADYQVTDLLEEITLEGKAVLNLVGHLSPEEKEAMNLTD